MHVEGQEGAGGVIGKYTGFKISRCPKHQGGRSSLIHKSPLIILRTDQSFRGMQPEGIPTPQSMDLGGVNPFGNKPEMTTSPPPVQFYHLAGSISEQLIPGQCVSLHARGGCLLDLRTCVSAGIHETLQSLQSFNWH